MEMKIVVMNFGTLCFIDVYAHGNVGDQKCKLEHTHEWHLNVSITRYFHQEVHQFLVKILYWQCKSLSMNLKIWTSSWVKMILQVFF